MLDASSGQADCVRDRRRRRAAVRDHGLSAQAEEVRAAVGVRVEPLAQTARRGPDQEAADLAASRGADLVADALEDRRDRALEELEADVAGEPVANDDVAGLAQDVPALDVAAEVEVALGEQRVRLERELVALLGLL